MITGDTVVLHGGGGGGDGGCGGGGGVWGWVGVVG